MSASKIYDHQIVYAFFITYYKSVQGLCSNCG